MRKVISLKQDSRVRLDTLEIDNLKIRLTYDSVENISSVTFEGAKKDIPDQKTMLDIILNINATWSSALRSTALINQNATLVGNTFNTNVLAISGTIGLIQNTTDYQESVNNLNPTLNTTPISGNILVAVIGLRYFPASQVNSLVQNGVVWALASAENVGSNDVEVWIGKVGVGAVAALQVNLSQTVQAGKAILLEFAGAVGTVDKTAVSTGNSTTPDTGTIAATTAANELWIGGLLTEGDGATAITAYTNGFTAVGDFTHPFLVLAAVYKIVTAINTANCSGTCVSAPWIGTMVTLT